MINKIPVIGWFFSILASVSLSVPFYFCWNAVAPVYFYFLPEIYHNIPFWSCVALFVVIPIIKHTFTPQFVRVVQSNNKG